MQAKNEISAWFIKIISIDGLVRAACLSTDYQALSVEQKYDTGPQDQRTMAKEPQGNIPSIIYIQHENFSSQEKITLSCLHLK